MVRIFRQAHVLTMPSLDFLIRHISMHSSAGALSILVDHIAEYQTQVGMTAGHDRPPYGTQQKAPEYPLNIC
jgi:hypothetical protein